MDTFEELKKQIESQEERIKNLVKELSVLEEHETTCQDNFEYEREEKAKWLGAIWNACYPDEWDDWEYLAQAYRLSLAQIVWMRNFLRKLFIQGWQDDADELHDILNAKAGEAPYVPSSQFEYQED
jgi:hypothetical protein